MTKEELATLSKGDAIRSTGSGYAFLITNVEGREVTAIDADDGVNPNPYGKPRILRHLVGDYWEMLSKTNEN